MSTTLPAEEEARLARLAELVHSTPDQVLPFVLRDGFAHTERVARAVMRSRTVARTGDTLPHEQALARLAAMLKRNATSQAA